jgi:hypothetical protein
VVNVLGWWVGRFVVVCCCCCCLVRLRMGFASFGDDGGQRELELGAWSSRQLDLSSPPSRLCASV